MRRPVRFAVTSAVIGLVVAACGSGEGRTPVETPPTVARVVITPTSAATLQNAFVTFAASVREASGRELSGHAVRWSVHDPSVASVDDSGRVTGILAGTTGIIATSEGFADTAAVQVNAAAVASVRIAPDSLDVVSGATASLSATALDTDGHTIAGRSPSWRSSDPAVATVAEGVVVGVAPGRVRVSATFDAMSAEAVVIVIAPPVLNLVLESAHLTQAVQRMDGTVPLIQHGNPVLVNVFITANRPLDATEASPQVRVRLYDGVRVVAEDVRAATGVIGTTSVQGRPSHQVVFPASVLTPGLTLTAELDPAGAIPQQRRDDDRFPRGTTAQPLDVRAVPDFDVHFIPIYLNVGQTLGNVSAANVPQYLIGLREMHPVAGVVTSIGAEMATDTPFGSGDPTAWQQILRELDARRVIEGSASYWFGAIKPPAGVTFVTNGGWAYIPGDAASTGPATRTALGVNLGWFTDRNKATELFAHEMAHTLGRFHAPCGGPAGPDPNYPYQGGLTGRGGYDMASYTVGGPIPPYRDPSYTGDIMGYCASPWVSDYTYEGILAFRQSGIVAASFAPNETPTTSILVAGRIDATGATLDPVLVARMRPAAMRSGVYVAEGFGEDGRALFRTSFTPTPVDHAPGTFHFALAIPLSDDDRHALARVVVRGPGVATESRSTGAMRAALAMHAPGAAALADADVPTATRLDARRVRIAWDASRWPSVMVRDRATGEVIGFGHSGALVLLTRASSLDVSISDGVQAEMTTVNVNGR